MFGSEADGEGSGTRPAQIRASMHAARENRNDVVYIFREVLEYIIVLRMFL